jgi:hypothetical protein
MRRLESQMTSLLEQLCVDGSKVPVRTQRVQFAISPQYKSVYRFLIFDETTVRYHSTGYNAFVNGLVSFVISDPFADFPHLVIDESHGKRPLISGHVGFGDTGIVRSGGFEILRSLRKLGLGTQYYRYLFDLAICEGYEFVVGCQRDANAAKFFLKQGRYLQEELHPEVQRHLGFEPTSRDHKVFNTIKILKEEDVAVCVLPEVLEQSVEARHQQKVLDQQIHDFLQRATSLTRAQQLREQYFSVDAVLNILEEVDQLCQFLSDEYQSPLDLGSLPMSVVRTDPTTTLQDIRTVIAHLRKNSWQLATSPKKREIKKFLKIAIEDIETEEPYDDGFDTSTDFSE